MNLKLLRRLLCLAAVSCISVTANAALVTYGTAGSEFNSGTLNQGWWSSGPGHSNSTTNDNHYTGSISSDTLRSFYSFDLSGISGTVTAATLRVQRGDQNGVVNLNLWDVSTAAALVNNNAGINSAIFNDLGTGNSYYSSTVSSGSFGDYLSFSLDSQALLDINAASGFFTIGASVGPSQDIFSSTGGDQTFLDLTISDVPEPASIALLGLGLFGINLARKRNQKN